MIVAIFARPLTQVALGVAAGVALLIGLSLVGWSQGIRWKVVGGFVLYGLLMMAVCMLAGILPTGRALRIEPTEALRGDK